MISALQIEKELRVMSKRERHFIAGLTKNLGYKRIVWWNYFKCGSFTIVCICGAYLRICLDKKTYDELPQAG